MGNKGNDFSSKLETNLHRIGSNQHHKAERLGKFDGSIIYDSTRLSDNKMGEALKIAFNVAGITAYIMGILTNWNNFISVILGVIGALFAIIRVAKAYEDWLFRRAERREKEHHVNKTINDE